MNTHDENNDDIDIEMEDEIVEESGMNDKIQKLRKQLKECEKESKENLNGWQRARADYANLQKNFEDERSAIRKRAVEDLILDIVPTLDNFEMAMKNTEVWETVDAKWRTGIEYIYTQLQQTLIDYGVERIDDANAEFDPELHEPLEVVDTDDESQADTIIDILQKGYRFNGRVIRPAKVKIYSSTSTDKVE